MEKVAVKPATVEEKFADGPPLTTMVWVKVLLPALLEAVNVTVYVPGTA